jgi:hypothetical protein
MSDIVMLKAEESQAVLNTVVQSLSPAIMSYLSGEKWHVAKVLMRDLLADRLYVEACHSAHKKPHPVNIRINQPVGLNFKHAYGKFIFDTTVVGLEPASNPDSGGTIVLAAPKQLGVVQRRSYFRVNVPSSLKVNVVVWHRSQKRRPKEDRTYFEGQLVDISAGGLQITMPLKSAGEGTGAGVTVSEFHRGQFVGVRFTPLPYETPIVFSAQIRNVLPTADHSSLCMGLQIVGLEASEEGRQVLARLATVVDHYHQVNQSGARPQDLQPTAPPEAAPRCIPAGALQ